MRVPSFDAASVRAPIWLLTAILAVLPVRAGETVVRVAVAANFAPCLAVLAEHHHAGGGCRIESSTASTGVLCAQISAGAPFDLLLAADADRPARLARDGGHGQPFPYAVGRLVFWNPDGPDTLVHADAAALADAVTGALSRDDRPLAVADARHAPYGEAARRTLAALGLTGAAAGRLVTGMSVGQTWQLIASRNAGCGFVALSQVLHDRRRAEAQFGGEALVVPAGLHDALEQHALLLGSPSPEAGAFAAYLLTDEARAIMAEFGYEAPPGASP